VALLITFSSFSQGRFVRTVLLWALTGISFLAASVMIGMNAMGFPDCIREAENA